VSCSTFFNRCQRLKRIFFLFVLLGFSIAHAGSYEDFFTAIKRDDAGAIISLLNRGFDPDTPNPNGEHGLILALREPSLKVIAALVQAPKINIEVRSSQDESPLMLASLQGLLDICEQLIAKGADVNKPGWTPLHYAATHGHLPVMHLLLEQSAYIDAASPNGTTPLMMAAKYGTPAAVQLLLEEGADARLKNDLGFTALDFAQQASRPDAIKLLKTFIRGLEPKGSW
jgi:ankyrin repeat protein